MQNDERKSPPGAAGGSLWLALKGTFPDSGCHWGAKGYPPARGTPQRAPARSSFIILHSSFPHP